VGGYSQIPSGDFSYNDYKNLKKEFKGKNVSDLCLKILDSVNKNKLTIEQRKEVLSKLNVIKTDYHKFSSKEKSLFRKVLTILKRLLRRDSTDISFQKTTNTISSLEKKIKFEEILHNRLTNESKDEVYKSVFKSVSTHLKVPKEHAAVREDLEILKEKKEQLSVHRNAVEAAVHLIEKDPDINTEEQQRVKMENLKPQKGLKLEIEGIKSKIRKSLYYDSLRVELEAYAKTFKDTLNGLDESGQIVEYVFNAPLYFIESIMDNPDEGKQGLCEFGTRIAGEERKLIILQLVSGLEVDELKKVYDSAFDNKLSSKEDDLLPMYVEAIKEVFDNILSVAKSSEKSI
ncbi:MAG: hypothetical protein WDZ27_05185, partial [Waddliaceae bacterium]